MVFLGISLAVLTEIFTYLLLWRAVAGEPAIGPSLLDGLA